MSDQVKVYKARYTYGDYDIPEFERRDYEIVTKQDHDSKLDKWMSTAEEERRQRELLDVKVKELQEELAKEKAESLRLFTLKVDQALETDWYKYTKKLQKEFEDYRDAAFLEKKALQEKLNVAKEALEYYKQFSLLPEDVQLKERIGGGKAAQTLKQLESGEQVKTEIYYWPSFDKIVEVQINPCGCHPFGFIATWGKKWLESGSFCFENMSQLRSYIRSKNWIKLQE